MKQAVRYVKAVKTTLCALSLAMLASAAFARTSLPGGYCELEYIQSTGKQIIDTGYKMNPKSKIEVDFQLTSFEAQDRIFGNDGVQSVFRTSFYVNGSKVFAFSCGDTFSGTTFTSADTKRHQAVLDAANKKTAYKLTTDGKTTTKANTLSVTKTATHPHTLFGRFLGDPPTGISYGAKMKLYSCQMYENEELVRDFVPCKRLTDEVIGLYDCIGQQFYTNAAPGETQPFTAGPIVLSDWITVAGEPIECGTPTPGYGDFPFMTPGESYLFSCPAVCTNATEDVAATCRGYRFAPSVGAVSTGTGNSTSIVYAATLSGSTLTWLWDVQYKATAKTRFGAVEATFAVPWTDTAGAVTVTAPPAPSRYRFVRWEGDGLAGVDVTQPTVTAHLTAPGTLTAVYRTIVTHVWTGAVSTDFATAGNWTDDAGAATNAPDAASIVYVPGGVAQGPTISSPISVAALHLGSMGGEGGTVTLTVKTAGVNAISGDFCIYTGGTVTHTALPTTATKISDECYKLNLSVGGDFAVQSGGEVNVVGKGFSKAKGPGYYSNRAGHAGSFHGSQYTYGSLACPTNCGSGCNSVSGGGVIRIDCAGTVRVESEGKVLADGSAGNIETGAGGSVWITARSLAGAGTISACGGDSNDGNSGSGGRVAVHLSQDTDFSAWHGTIAAHAGKAPGSSRQPGPAGTVYRQAAGQSRTNATVIIDNNNNIIKEETKPKAWTDLGAKSGADVLGTVVVSGLARVKVLEDEEISVYGSWLGRGGSFLESNGRIRFAGAGEAKIEGAMAFGDVICTEPGKTLVFGTQGDDVFAFREASTLTLSGAADNLLDLRGEGGAEWKMGLAASCQTEISYISVSNSNASVGEVSVLAVDSVDLGGNVNWGFSGKILPGDPITWTGAVDGDWANTANWEDEIGGHRAPVETDEVTIPGGCPNYPTISSGTLLQNRLTVSSGASLTLNGGNLVVTNGLAVHGAFVFADRETLNCPASVDFSGATVTPGRSTLFLTGGANQQANLGDCSFNRIEITKDAGQIDWTGGFTARIFDCRFDGAGTMTFLADGTFAADEFYCRGQATDALVLGSSVPGTRWKLDLTVRHYFAGVRVGDSQAIGVTAEAGAGSFDAGNNDNWNFAQTGAEWTGAKSSDFADAANWYPQAVPGASSRVLILSRAGETKTVVSSAAVEVRDLVLSAEFGKISFQAGAPLTVSGDLDVRTNATLILNAPQGNSVSGDVTVRAGAKLTHSKLPTTAATVEDECYKFRLSVGGDMTVETGGGIDVSGCGFSNGQGPGAGKTSISNMRMGNYGGTIHSLTNLCYGSVFRPFDCGSGAYNSSSSAGYGGGVVRLSVAGSLALNGTINANGTKPDDWISGSGGSVWVICGTLTGTGDISADSADVVYDGSGSGGRVAIYAGNTNGYTGKVSAFGGYNGTIDRQHGIGGPGTVYVETTADGAGRGVLSIDNSHVIEVDAAQKTKRLPGSMHGWCELPAPDDKLREYRDVTVVCRNSGDIRFLSDLKIYDLIVKEKWVRLDLFGNTVTVRSRTHHDQKGWAACTVYTNEVHGTAGRLVWQKEGLCVMIR